MLFLSWVERCRFLCRINSSLFPFYGWLSCLLHRSSGAEFKNGWNREAHFSCGYWGLELTDTQRGPLLSRCKHVDIQAQWQPQTLSHDSISISTANYNTSEMGHWSRWGWLQGCLPVAREWEVYCLVPRKGKWWLRFWKAHRPFRARTQTEGYL